MRWHEKQKITFMPYIQPYLTEPAVQSMGHFIQHGTTTTLQHALSVTRISCQLALFLQLNVNYENLAVGALLHDFYLYDWHSQPPEGVLHGFAHPHIACQNAVLYYQVNPEVQHIITTHMWPLTLRFPPHSKEAFLVCAADKYCSTIETIIGLWGVTKSFFSHVPFVGTK